MRECIEREYEGLKFLRHYGIDCVPGPLEVDYGGCAIYEYVEGTPFRPADVKDEDIDVAVDFLAKLRGLTDKPESQQLLQAAEACLSLADICGQIERRLDRLLFLNANEPIVQQVRRFLQEEFTPAWRQLERSAQEGGLEDAVLPREQQTLSPSDFGFHNAVRRSNGQVVFVDFEYFGWDDPAKMAVDFLLHPQMELSDAHKRRFLARLLDRFEPSAALRERIKTVYPLFGLKWCLILLNEFLPDQAARRQFASTEPFRPEKMRVRQLEKAQTMLRHVLETYDPFPYLN